MLQSAFFISAAVVFNIGIYLTMGSQRGVEFTTGYLMELMLSVDNLFVFVLVFASFCIPAMHQHKVLFYGILGALVFRMAFIFAGVTLMTMFHWILYVFGIFLIYTGIKMAVSKGEDEVSTDDNAVVKLFKRFMRVTNDGGEAFFVRKPDATGKLVRWATPMFICLIVVETTDVLFAVDSIPAILGITVDSYIVFSSNAFAILGLRSMYFALAHIIDKFRYLNYGLAAILTFVGLKMLLSEWLAENYHVHIEAVHSLIVIVAILAIAIVASHLKNKRDGPPEPKTVEAVCPMPEAEEGEE